MRFVKPKNSSEKPSGLTRFLNAVEKAIKIRWRIPKCPSGKKCVVREMHPLDFLSRVPSPCREGHTALEDLDLEGCWDKESLEYIRRMIEEGREIEAPILDYTRWFRGFPTHEGRHRARVAYELGESSIPVLVVESEDLCYEKKL